MISDGRGSNSGGREQAEALALQALAWLAADAELLATFLGSTGATLDDLRSRAEEPAFLGSILDFVLMDDRWIRRFCDATGLPYDAPLRARVLLPGGTWD